MLSPRIIGNLRAWAACAVAAALMACQTQPVQAPAPAATRPAEAPRGPAPAPVLPPPSTLAALAAEQRQMADLFRGTPVVFSLLADGSLRVEVPLTFCFDPGRAVVKPPLAAVLDRVARSQRHQNTRVRANAPADATARTSPLGRERSVAIRDYMTARGVGFTRFAAPAGSQADVVEIVVSDAAPQPRP